MNLHLVCNAHIDPVWLWQRTEGFAEAISTFRIAADFCERYDDFVFNHNESVLYEVVRENDSELFERIQKLVKRGKWRIMGGWYLQPDVIMPCGESIIRQIRVGNEFFKEYFGEIPKTAISFDAFGHSRGLVQILKKCGYDNYAHWRPPESECKAYLWKGYDGCVVNCVKLFVAYNTPKGKALERVREYIEKFPHGEPGLLTWGIGNHGGGPSEKDLNDINQFAKESEINIIHSDFDTYFNELDKTKLQVVESSLMHCMVGCYTSMARIKQEHRNLENKLAICEKILCVSGAEYDEDELKNAEKALLFNEFHDILPGTMIKKAEEDSLRLFGYGNEIADKMITKSFFKLCRRETKAKAGEIPVFVYNPHPYPIEGDFEVEFNLADSNRKSNGIYDVFVKDESGEYVPSQLEKEDSTHGFDWRKKVVFHAMLKPMGITRFDCETRLDKDYVTVKPFAETDDHIIFKSDNAEIQINKDTGLIDKYIVSGREVLKSLCLKAFRDNEDPWGMKVDGFSDCIGEFKPDGFVKVVENGEVRSKVQARFRFGKSYALLTYTFSKFDDMLDVDVKILANDENTMFKLCVDTTLDKSAKAKAQMMFGTEEVRKGGREVAFQKWCGLEDDKNRLDIINGGTYGGCMNDGEIQISLLRTAVYSAHPVKDVELAPKDRIYEHIDMGERNFRFRIASNLEFTDCEAEIFNQKPISLSYFPSGTGDKNKTDFCVDNRNILLSAFRKVKDGTQIRLFNSAENGQSCNVNYNGKEMKIDFDAYEVKTYLKTSVGFRETNMLGE